MMFGLRDRFAYFECASCGCLQIEEVPHDLGRYYPADYYSLQGVPDRHTGLRGRLRTVRNRFVLTGEGVLGRALAAVSDYPFPGIRQWLSREGLSHESRILDVGCGSGELLYDLGALGYRHLTGVDPFIQRDLVHPTGATIRRGTIHELQGEYDLVMFHHSLEHIPDQHETMRSAARLLAEGGHCLVRIPVVGSAAWEEYGVDWVQLDAPRHLFVHSVESIRRLGEGAGLRLEAVEHDSTEFQFTGSELYRRDIPLRAADPSRFGRAELRRFRSRARELNAAGRGDQAAFYFRKEGDGRSPERKG